MVNIKGNNITEERLRAIYEDNPSMYFTVDSEGIIISINKFGAEQLGYKVEELVGKPVLNVFYDDDKEAVQNQFKMCLQNPMKLYSWEFRKVRKDASILWVRESARAVKDSGGKTSILIICEDITDRKKIEEELNQYREHLEILVEKHTTELTSIKEQLQQEINEHKQTEIALRKSEAKFYSLFKNTFEGVYQTRPDGKILSANPALVKMLGYDSEEELCFSTNAQDLYTNRNDRKELIRKLEEEGELRNVELGLRRKDGKEITVLENTRIVQDEHGKVSYFEGVLTDITARKLADNALRESEKRYRHIVDNANDIIYATDETGHFTFFNIVAVRTMGYSEKEFKGKHYLDLIRADYKKDIKRFYDLQFLGKIPNTYQEFPVITKDGQEIWLGQNVQLVLEENRVEGFQAVARDITQRKKAEEALRESEGKYRSLIENIQDGVFLIQDAKFLYVNEAGAKMVGHTVEEVIGKNFEYLIAPEDLELVANRYRRRQAGENLPKEYEFHMLHKDGKTRVNVNLSVGITIYQGRVASIGTIKDITEHKKAEEAIRESEERYRTLQENIPIGIYRTTPDGKIISANPAMVKIFGFNSEEEFVVHSAKNFYLVPQQRKKFIEQLRDKIEVTGFEIQMKRKNGSIFWGSLNTKAVSNIHGKTTHLDGILEDITERKRTEEALRESEERFKNIAENALEWIWEADASGKYTYVSPVVEQILGYKPDELLDKHFYDFFHQDDIEEIKKTAFEVFSKKQPFREFINRNIHKNGKIVWLSTSGVPMLDNKGNLLGYRGVDTDITNRIQSEKAIIRAKDEWEKTFDSISEFISIIDKEFTIKRVNKALADRLGIIPQEVVGLKCYKIIHGLYEPPDFCPHAKMLKDGQEHATEIHEKNLGGDFLITVAPLKDIDGKLIGGVHTSMDISERKKMEHELLKSEKLEALGFLAGGIAHDFNNILAGVMGYISLAKIYADKKDQVVSKLNNAEKAISRAKDLTQQLLTFSKGGAPIRRPASITELLRDTLDFTLSGSTVRCNYSIPDNLWTVEIDEGQVSQVIQNLIINAEQSMPKGGTVQIRVKNSNVKASDGLPLEEGRYIKVIIKDTGIGVPQDHLAKIFDPFFTTKQKGSGLGLSTAYSIIKNHKGLITVESELGKGTTFYIYLPATKKKTAKKKETQNMATGEGKILFMDDEDMILKPNSEILQKTGYTVVTAKDGTDAIKLYKKAKKSKYPFDIVILDLIVPGGMGGKKTVKELIKIDPEVKAIVSSGYSTDPIIANSKEYGFVCAISKPYQPKELIAILQKIITGSE